MRFSEYAFQKDKKELIEFLIENNVNQKNINLEYLIESGWWDRTKQGIKKGLAKGALLAAMPGMMGNMYTQPQELPNPKPFNFLSQKLMDNEQNQKDQMDDKAYINAGGPEFEQTLKDTERFLKFKSTPQHQEILRKAGFSNDYIPSPLRHFAYGQKVSTVTSSHKESMNIIQGEIKKRFGRDCFVEIVSTKDTVTGGQEILLDVSGIVMAFDQNDAIKRVEAIVREIAKDQGYNLAGFKEAGLTSTDVSPAPRSTIDYVQENSGQPIRFSVRIRLLK